MYQADPADGAILNTFKLPSYGEVDPNGWGLAWDSGILWHTDYEASLMYRLPAIFFRRNYHRLGSEFGDSLFGIRG